MRKQISKEESNDFVLIGDGLLRFRAIIYMPPKVGLREEILKEAYRSKYTMHLRTSKMYHDLKKNFWWLGMKVNVTNFVSSCLTC